MTVALLLAAAPDRLSAMAHPYQHPGDHPAVGAPWLDFMGDRLMSAGVRQVDVAMCADAADGLRAVAVTARDTGEPVLVCTSARALATPGPELAELLGRTGTVALAADGALLVARRDLAAVADAADALAARFAAGDGPEAGHRLSLRRINRRTRVSGDLDTAVESLIELISGRGVQVAALAVNGNGATAAGAAPPRPLTPPAEPGLLARVVVAPVAGRLARWAVGRGLAPEAFTTAAFALTVCAAAWFAAGHRSSLITGSALLCVALPVRQAGGWRRARRSAGGERQGASAFGGWLDVTAGAAAEYAVYAGLAAGWTAARPHQAWTYATAAMILLAVRQMTDACYAAVAGPRPAPAGPGHRLLRLTGQTIALPTAERTLLIAVTASVAGPRLALTVLIGWGAVALGYTLAERAVASRVLAVTADAGEALLAARDDGPLAIRVGRVVQGQLPPLLPAVAGVTVTAMLAALGLGNLPGLLLFAPAVAMLLAALGADNPHTGRFDWLVPPLLQAGQYVYLAALAFGTDVPAPAMFAVIAAIALHHMDLLLRQRRGIPPAPGVITAGLGWEGRMLVAGFGGMLGIEAFVFIALAVYLWGLFGWDSLTSWLTEAGASSR